MNKKTDQSLYSLSLKKGGCLDVCSSYKIAIYSTGKYHYKGYYNVQYRGEKSGQLENDKLIELNKLIEAIHWEDLDSTYGNPANDSQRKELEYSTKNTPKKIIYYHLEPLELRDLERHIDLIINHDEF